MSEQDNCRRCGEGLYAMSICPQCSIEGYVTAGERLRQLELELAGAATAPVMRATILRHWSREEIESFALHLLGDEWQQLKAENEHLVKRCNVQVKLGRELIEERDQLKAENEELRKALAADEVEWCDHCYVDGSARCPWCGNDSLDGHAKDCQRQAALKQGGEEWKEDKDGE